LKMQVDSKPENSIHRSRSRAAQDRAGGAEKGKRRRFEDRLKRLETELKSLRSSPDITTRWKAEKEKLSTPELKTSSTSCAPNSPMRSARRVSARVNCLWPHSELEKKLKATKAPNPPKAPKPNDGRDRHADHVAARLALDRRAGRPHAGREKEKLLRMEDELAKRVIARPKRARVSTACGARVPVCRTRTGRSARSCS